MSKEKLQRQVAQLQSRLDQIETELSTLNQMLIRCGFPDGIRTLKTTIRELFEDRQSPFHSHPEDLPPIQTFDL